MTQNANQTIINLVTNCDRKELRVWKSGNG
uniref:Uncharacterized protein n=1 Tax=Myoviridae sp. ct31P9 TaxID=2827657 RepID=A0A8S5T3Z3_9CAUD|nr:MAG TPA: hypothetical protein [Caudoviricetes sp.]DAF57739.1 MAG TPA: hypothetical protein [Myoviridae sp. ct31P9]